MSRASGFTFDYDEDDQTLTVDTGDAVYQYYGVPHSAYAAMMNDYAPTRYWTRNIQPNYRVRRIG